ncbi:Protein of unknown function [Thalassospira xiamenensis]|uniref:HTH DNA binding domain-containing protein n=2 Tax=Thalassospira xiamenensis TaxID=220697 RepID=A0A285TY41_9PROT|nr:Protein of unknown function [Thalassospira xiamenensis]
MFGFQGLTETAEISLGVVKRLNDATQAITKLNESLRLAPERVREGWIERAVLAEAVSSARLSGDYVIPEDLRLVAFDAYDGPISNEMSRTADLLPFLRVASRRSPRQMFTPLRLVAMTRLRLKAKSGTGFQTSWISTGQREQRDFDDIRYGLEEVFSPENVSRWKSIPPLMAAAEILYLWNTSGCDEMISPEAGRVLASAWLARSGLTEKAWVMISTGFHEDVFSFSPGPDSRWHRKFARGVELGCLGTYALLNRLEAAHRAFEEVDFSMRSSSNLPRVVDLLFKRIAVTTSTASTELGISSRACASILERLLHDGPKIKERPVVQELTGRSSFRVYGIV